MVKGHIWHNIASRRPERLMGPGEGNKDVNHYATAYRFHSFMPSNSEYLGSQFFQCHLVQARKISLGFSLLKIPFRGGAQ